MGDHVDPRSIDVQIVHQAIAAMLGVHDDRIEALVQASLGGELARARLAWHDVVGSEYERAGHRARSAWCREQMSIEVLNREPLEMHDIRRPRSVAVAQHVRDMLRELGDALSA
jgi:hypothetical protein